MQGKSSDADSSYRFAGDEHILDCASIARRASAGLCAGWNHHNQSQVRQCKSHAVFWKKSCLSASMYFANAK